MLTKLFVRERAEQARAPTERTPDIKMAIENNVYLAKLAEQAERYEGRLSDTLLGGTR